jgi:imidazolonepropionase-like amidohydrolase
MRSFVFSVVSLLTAAAAASAPSAEPLLIAAEKIYTSPEAPPLANGLVLLREGRIAAVADERSRIAVPAGTRTSECRGVVVAGFQNSHVHFMGGAFDSAAGRPAAEVEQAVESMLTKYGFTTVVDTGSALADTLSIRTRIEKGEIRGPRILTAGWPLYPKDGIPFYLRDLPKHVLDGLQQPADAAEARADVRGNLAAGADATKLFVHTSPDGTSPRFMALETARAAADETHSKGKLVLAHPTSVEGIRGALAAGVDVIVHTTLGERVPWDEALTREMVAKNMAVVPTFMLWPYELAKQNVPAEVIDRLVAATLAELRSFVAAGGQVLFGTDVGYMREFDPTPEYVYMEKAGLTSAQILASLTTGPAKRWKEDGRRGKVEPGMDADLVVLAADPAADVRHFAQVRCVFRAGKLIYASTPQAPVQVP